ncbi:MAG: ABC transporter substrate-binding protein [Thermodesulfobacteriota bacterium]
MLALSLPAAAKTRGVTKDTILVGSYQTLSGPAAIVAAVGRGADAYFKMVNERGGIHGRKIKFVIVDDQLQVARTVAAVKKLVEQEGVFGLAAGMNTNGTLAVVPYLQKMKVPSITGVSATECTFPPRKYIFTVRPVSFVEGLALAKYAVEHLKAKRIAIAYMDDGMGKDITRAAKQVMATYGLKPVAEAALGMQDVDYASQALVIKDSKPDLVLLACSFRQTPKLLVEAKKIGLLKQTKWLGATVSNTPITLRMAGKGTCEGVYLAGSMPAVDSPDPKCVEFRTYFHKYYPKENVYSILGMVGWASAQVFAEGLRRAGKDLTVEGFVKALESIKNWKGSLMYDQTYGPNRRDGDRYIRMCQVKNDKIVEIQGFFTLSDKEAEKYIKH